MVTDLRRQMKLEIGSLAPCRNIPYSGRAMLDFKVKANTPALRAESTSGELAPDALNRTFWFTAGFFFPVGGSLLSQFYQPFMPTARVLGKSPEYIAFYYDAYKVKTKKLQFKWALAGCLIGTPLSTYLITAVF